MKYVNHIQINQTNKTSIVSLFIKIITLSGAGTIIYILGFVYLLQQKQSSLKLFAFAGLLSIGFVLITKGKHVYCEIFFLYYFVLELFLFIKK